VAGSYLWSTLVQPFLARPPFPDFSKFYTAAAAIHAGADPYTPFFASGRYDYSQSYYIYPPLTAWLVQPLLPLGGENAALAALVGLHACVALFVWLVYRALRPPHPHEAVLGALLVLGFNPLYANLWNAQVNVVLLPLSALVLLAFVKGDRWWGGAAFGLELALKPLQPAVGLLLVWGRRWRMVAVTGVAGLAASLLPGPGLFFEYIFRVLLGAAGGTGFRDNAAPAGFFERLLHPAAFYDGTAPGGLAVRLLYLATVVAVVALTWWGLGTAPPRADPLDRALEFAAAVAASPLLLTVSHSFHLVMLLLPILVLTRAGVDRGDNRLLAAALGAWLLIGPIHGAMLAAISVHFSIDPVLRVWNESQLLGILLLWLGCLGALRGRPSSHPAPLLPRPRFAR
jgi:hypothetical protein